MHIKIPPAASGMNLLEYLSAQGYALPAACGGKGRCGKCRVGLLAGKFTDAEGKPIFPDADGTILSCRAFCPPEGGEVALSANIGEGLTRHIGGNDAQTQKAPTSAPARIGVALDIGTTTLGAVSVDLASGAELDSISCLNPQSSWGADVISRIQACGEGKLSLLTRTIREKTNELIDALAEKAGRALPLERLVVVGNTTMLHLFCGVSPEGIGCYPFTPVFTEEKRYSGEELGLHALEVQVLPSAAAYIGSDVTAGMLAVGMGADAEAEAEADTPSLLLDIGTNGEAVVDTGHGFLAAATAAGPAMEGAHISCGVGGIPGAVNHVELSDGGLRYTTIPGAEGASAPAGLCGAGLLDLIAALLELGVIDETGALDEDACPDGIYRLCEGVSLTGGDIREFQLAKSAIRSGVELLVRQAGYEIDALKHVYLAGGLGFYLNQDSAIRTGLLPAAFAGKITVVGNSALAGAVRCLCSDADSARVSKLAKACAIYELNTSSEFTDAFMENMFFE